MTTFWLRDQLVEKNVIVDNGNPVLSVTFAGRTERVYCPDSDEYRITADVVAKAKELGATIIVYSTKWCGITAEGKLHAKNIGIYAMPYNAFFAYLRSKGV